MGHDFDTDNQISVDATPEQVWEAIATGPGIDSWFMGRNTVEPREGGSTEMVVAEMFTAHGSVTAWEPPHRFATRSDTARDGTFHAFEYLVEGATARAAPWSGWSTVDSSGRTTGSRSSTRCGPATRCTCARSAPT